MAATDDSDSLLEAEMATLRTARPSERGVDEIADDVITALRRVLLRRAIKVGARFPPFVLGSSTGEVTRSASLLERGPLVMNLNRGSWCVYCAAELSELEQRADEFSALGATIVSVSPEKAELQEALRIAKGLSFSLLVDHGLRVARSLGLAYAVPAELRSLYESTYGFDLATINADGQWALPISGRIVIDQTGIVRDVAADPDHRRRPDPDTTLEVLRQLA
jgi:peroxiredoxin